MCFSLYNFSIHLIRQNLSKDTYLNSKYLMSIVSKLCKCI